MKSDQWAEAEWRLIVSYHVHRKELKLVQISFSKRCSTVSSTDANKMGLSWNPLVIMRCSRSSTRGRGWASKQREDQRVFLSVQRGEAVWVVWEVEQVSVYRAIQGSKVKPAVHRSPAETPHFTAHLWTFFRADSGPTVAFDCVSACAQSSFVCIFHPALGCAVMNW